MSSFNSSIHAWSFITAFVRELQPVIIFVVVLVLCNYNLELNFQAVLLPKNKTKIQVTLIAMQILKTAISQSTRDSDWHVGRKFNNIFENGRNAINLLVSMNLCKFHKLPLVPHYQPQVAGLQTYYKMPSMCRTYRCCNKATNDFKTSLAIILNSLDWSTVYRFGSLFPVKHRFTNRSKVLTTLK